MTLHFLFDYINAPQRTYPSSQRFAQALKWYLSLPGNTIEDESPYGGTLLLVAIQKGSIPIVKILLNHGAYVNETAFNWAINKISILECLLEQLKAQSPNSTQGVLNNILLMILKIENRPTIEWLLKNGADINYKNSYGQTALMLTVDKGSFKLAKFLLDYQPNIDLQDKDGNTALLYAACNSQTSIDMIQLLVKKGASLIIENQFNQTPLMAAATAGLNKASMLFLEHCPLVVADPHGYSALNNALANRRMKVANTLIQYGVSLKFMPTTLTLRTKGKLFDLFAAALRLMPIGALPLRRISIFKHNIFMRQYAKEAAQAVAINSKLPIHVSRIVNTYLFRDADLIDVYHEEWKEKDALVFSSPIASHKREYLGLKTDHSSNETRASKRQKY